MPFSRKAKYRKPAKRPRAKKTVTKTTTKTTAVVAKRIPRSMSMSKGPFPKILNTTLVYKHPSANITSGGAFSFNYLNLAANSLFDYDITDVLGNKQPLFFDQLVSANGPYRWYKVNAWKTTIKLINLSDKAMYTYFDPASSLMAETDTAAELENRRGVQFQILTAQSNAKPYVTFKSYRSLKSWVPKSVNSSENYSAPAGQEPSQRVFQTLAWRPIDGSITAFTVAVQVSTVFYCTFYNNDSIAS